MLVRMILKFLPKSECSPASIMRVSKMKWTRQKLLSETGTAIGQDLRNNKSYKSLQRLSYPWLSECIARDVWKVNCDPSFSHRWIRSTCHDLPDAGRQQNWALFSGLQHLGEQFKIILSMVGDPLEHFSLGRPVQCAVSVTVLNHKAEVSDCTHLFDEYCQLRQQNPRSVH
jgi:hypothetical protein